MVEPPGVPSLLFFRGCFSSRCCKVNPVSRQYKLTQTQERAAMTFNGIDTVKTLASALKILSMPQASYAVSCIVSCNVSSIVLFISMFTAMHSYAVTSDKHGQDNRFTAYQLRELYGAETAVAGPVVHSRDQSGYQSRIQWARAGNQISMREAISQAKRRFPGKVLAAKRSVNRQGKTVYRIKIISNSSEIRTISIAAEQ